MANTSTSNVEKCWYFTKEQIENTPSRKCGFDARKELSHRQQAANFIQDMGQRLKVSQLCINTAIVYMHRFYVFHSFTHFPWYQMAAAALFLAAKVEEQPRKLEYVIRVATLCRNGRDSNISIDVNSERYIQQSQDLVFNENVLLQTLGFDVAIDHPHTHVVKCCHLVRASKDLAQTSYFMASNSLHLTTMCIQYKPTVVACFCILVACKWSNWEIPLSNEKREWYYYVDPTVTADLLQQLTEEFLVIFEACPSRLKEKIMATTDGINHNPPPLHANSLFDTDPKKIPGKEDSKHLHRSSHESKSGTESDPHKHRSGRPHDASSSSQQQRDRERNRERERLAAAHQKALIGGQNKVLHNSHHRPPLDRLKPPHPRPVPVRNYIPKDILREAAKDSSSFGLVSKDYREHGNKDVNVRGEKRDYLFKPTVTPVDMNSYSDARVVPGFSADKRVEMNRPKVPAKHEAKPYLKQETEIIKKHLSASVHDKNNSFLSKSLSSTSQKMERVKSPDISKSVLKLNLGQMDTSLKQQQIPNGSESFYDPVRVKLEHPGEVSVKIEPVTVKEEPIIKRPSLFSPEQTPPRNVTVKTEPEIKTEMPATPSFSPLSSPLTIKRNRNYSSSSSEPELRPVMKKIDQVEGFENLIRDSTIGINKLKQEPDIVVDVSIVKEEPVEVGNEEMKPPAVVPARISEHPSKRCTIVNGLETNPVMISNLLKEVSTVPHLSAVAAASSDNSASVAPQPELKGEKDHHHHHKSKKKNKEKHKHKDKERSREDKERKKKHKDKDREKHKSKEKHDGVAMASGHAEPIKLKIQKDRIQPVAVPENSLPIQGLKIKIPKDKIKTEAISELSQAQPPVLPMIGIKLKIPKEKLNNCVGLETFSKKRDRDKSSPSEMMPPAKVAKTSQRDAPKQNGRHPYNKVAHSGDGDPSLHRLAESKYTHKNTTS